jgi:hypothetical protein
VVADDCETAWDESVSPEVVCTIDNVDYKYGSGCNLFTVGFDATVGHLATNDFGPIDARDYNYVKFWIKSSVAINSGDLKYQLDDTPGCVSPLKEIDIGALSADNWTEKVLSWEMRRPFRALLSRYRHGYRQGSLYTQNRPGALYQRRLKLEPVYIEPVESERKYQRLAELGARLKMPVTEAFLTLRVLDRNGQVIHHTRRRSHSWTRNAYQMLATAIGGMRNSGAYADGSLATKNTGGSVISNVYLANTGGVSSNFNVDSEAVGKAYRGPNGDNVSGIVIGTGDTPESFNDYALAAALAEGTGAGQVNYMAASR